MPTKLSCSSDEESELRRGPWTLEEDNLLVNYISAHGEGRWNLLAKCAGLKRTGKSCRLRWLNYLKPDVKRGNLSPQEQLVILELHSKWGNRWSKIAQQLPGRTDNEIKNYWRTRVQKQARQLNIDTSSESFLNAIRCFWMPALPQNTDPLGPSHSAAAPSLPIPAPPPAPPLDPATVLPPGLLPEFSDHPASPYAFDCAHPFPASTSSSMVDDTYGNPPPTSDMDGGFGFGYGFGYMPDVQTGEMIDWGGVGMDEAFPIWNMEEHWPPFRVD